MARLPPSTGSRIPVTQRAASEAREDGRPLHVVGLPQAAPGEAPQPLLLHARVPLDALAQVGVQDLGEEDGVDPHPAAGPLRAQLAGHLGDAAHGGAVGGVAPPHGRQAGQGADVDDAAPAGGEHAPARLLAAAEPPHHQPLQGPAHIVEDQVLRRPEDDLAAGDVGQNVDAAELAVQALEHGPDLLRVGDVAAHRHGAPAQGPDVGGGGRGAGLVEVGQHQVGAGLGQGQGDGAAHAPGGARDQGGATAQIEQGVGHSSSSKAGSWGFSGTRGTTSGLTM